ncbi:MAG: hypothetical protein HXL12_00840 [Candidatus Nanosynbacter sp.]|nr:hypothetical protein [Candidatus Nanosynbacter sp.]
MNLNQNVFAVDPPKPPQTGKHDGGSGHPVEGCSKSICYTVHQDYSGVTWIYYDFAAMGIPENKRDRIPYSTFANTPAAGYPKGNQVLPTAKGDNAVTGCGRQSGVFIFGYNRYYRKTLQPTGGVAIPLSYSVYLAETEPKIEQTMYGGGSRIKIEEAKNEYTGAKYLGYPDPEKLADWNRGNFSWFCAWPIQQEQKDNNPQPPAATAQTTCSQLSGNFGAYYKGNTSADTGVVNHSYSGTLGHNSWQKNFQGKNYVFAKPGDRVQFYETFCFPIQQVGIQTGSSNVSSADPPGESNFQIFAQKNGSENNQYLFGDSPVHDGNYHTIGRGNKRPFSGSGLETSDYGFTAYSPTQNASSEYGCQTNYYRMYAPKLTVGYQIPGFIDYQHGCNSADKTGSTTEVGTVISQGIRYDNLRAWYNEYTTWSGRDGAENVHHHSYNSFDSAGDARGGGASWGSQGNSTYEVKVPTGRSYCVHESERGCLRRKKEYIYVTHWKKEYPDSHVGTTTQNLGQTEKKSSVYTPYNFNTSIHSYIESSQGGVGFLGARISIGANYGVAPRANELVSKTPYATHTREDQTVKVYEMIVDENYPESKLQEQTVANGNICRGSGIERCKLVDTVIGRINSVGKYTGEFLNTDTYDRTIPDDLPGGGLGKKYCTRSVIWPAASHDSDSNTVENNMSGSAMSGGNNLHHVSAASCVTLAKKPNFQVLGGGFYTNGTIKAALSEKAVGGGLGAYPSAETRSFGSWDEFGVLAAGKVLGFGSGAAMGYEEGYNFNLPRGGIMNAYYTFIGPTGPNSVVSGISNISHMTIANDKNGPGNSGISRIGSAVLARLKARFRDTIIRNSSNTITSLTSNETSAKNYLGLSQLYHQGDTSLSAMNSTANFYQFDHGGNLIARSNTTGEKLMNTLAMFVDGTLTIDRNINIAHETYNAVDDFPQVLIFAKKINITSNVTNIDAWLILDEDYGDNQIDTCSDNHYPNALSCNETLTITGPVFARKLILNRTAGSHTGGGRAGAHPLQTGPTGTYYAEGSIHPAEVFTLRADAYFWAYRQSLSGGQAYMVYSREIAPRY